MRTVTLRSFRSGSIRTITQNNQFDCSLELHNPAEGMFDDMYSYKMRDNLRYYETIFETMMKNQKLYPREMKCLRNIYNTYKNESIELFTYNDRYPHTIVIKNWLERVLPN